MVHAESIVKVVFATVLNIAIFSYSTPTSAAGKIWCIARKMPADKVKNTGAQLITFPLTRQSACDRVNTERFGINRRIGALHG